jgi:hypothetical protein
MHSASSSPTTPSTAPGCGARLLPAQPTQPSGAGGRLLPTALARILFVRSSTPSTGIQAESGFPPGVFQLSGPADPPAHATPFPLQRSLTRQVTTHWPQFLRQHYAGTVGRSLSARSDSVGMLLSTSPERRMRAAPVMPNARGTAPNIQATLKLLIKRGHCLFPQL